MLDINSFKDYSNIYSASYPRIDQSIAHAKKNRIVLDNACNWYLFEGQVLMGMPILNKYKNTIFNLSMQIKIEKEYFRKPEYVSYTLYGSTDLWYVLLFLNEMKNPDEFTREIIRVIDPSRITDFIRILDSEYGELSKREDPILVNKHYLKHPDLPSDQLLPDSLDDEIEDNGMKDYESHSDFSEWDFNNDIGDFYYHGKSRMQEIGYVKTEYVNLDKRYMDSIHLSNHTKGTLISGDSAGNTFKYNGYIWVGKDGEYEFEFCGINGMANMIINNQFIFGEDGKSNITLPNIDREYDFYERKYKNSDFKKRNQVGWNFTKEIKGRLVTDTNLRKPVYMIKFNDLEDVQNREILCNTLKGTEVTRNKEPLSVQGSDTQIMYEASFSSRELENIKLVPFIRCNYEDGSSNVTYGYEDDWKTLLNTQDYMNIKIVIDILPGKTVETVDFGFIVDRIKEGKLINGELRIDSNSIYLLGYNTGKIVINGVNPTGKWLPYIVNYMHNSDPEMMFSLKWKQPDDEGFSHVDRGFLAITCSNSERDLKESVLVAIKNDRTEEELLISTPSQNINVTMVEDCKVTGSKVSYKGVINLFDVETIYSVELPRAYKIKAHFDGQLVFEGTGTELNFLINPENKILYRRIIESRGYKEVPFRVDIYEVPVGEIWMNFGYFDGDEVIPLKDTDFMINPKVQLVDAIANETKSDIDIVDLFKHGWIKFEDVVHSRPNSDKFILEFDATIDSIDNGQFIINMDKNSEAGTSYSLVFNYEVHEGELPSKETIGLIKNWREEIKIVGSITSVYKDKYNYFYILDDRNIVYKYNYNGRLIWKKYLPADQLGYLYYNIYAGDEGNILLTNDGGRVLKLSGINGNILWETSIDDGFILSLAVEKSTGNIFVSTASSIIHVLDNTGKKISDYQSELSSESIMFLADGYLYCFGNRPNSMVFEQTELRDEDGNIVRDEEGNIIWVPKLDEDGNMIIDKSIISTGVEILDVSTNVFDITRINMKSYNNLRFIKKAKYLDNIDKIYLLTDTDELYFMDHTASLLESDPMTLPNKISAVCYDDKNKKYCICTEKGELILYEDDLETVERRANVSTSMKPITDIYSIDGNYYFIENYDPSKDIYSSFNSVGIDKIIENDYYNAPNNPYINFTLENGLYKSYPSLQEILLSDIDPGIDFYKGKYQRVPVYRNIEGSFNMKTFRMKQGVKYHFKLRKKKDLLIMHMNGNQICAWKDVQEGDYSYENLQGGYNGFVFFNLEDIKIENFIIYD